MKKFTAAAFMFLICTTALLSTTAQLRRVKRPIFSRCQCIKIHSQPPIPIKRIISLKVFPAGPHCKHEEIIARLKKGPTCLNPNVDWVISLKEEFSSFGPQLKKPEKSRSRRRNDDNKSRVY
uniref:Interleukin-8 n=1 Tax=Gobiocypris rarus TaxID=143606 RepID=A0A2U9I596_GOBRA|nr:interleukin-8 [Gobiocypris rarus]